MTQFKKKKRSQVTPLSSSGTPWWPGPAHHAASAAARLWAPRGPLKDLWAFPHWGWRWGPYSRLLLTTDGERFCESSVGD